MVEMYQYTRGYANGSGLNRRVHLRFWGGTSLAGNQCQRCLELVTVFGRDGVQAPGLAVRWRPSVGEGARAGTYGDLMGLAGRGRAGHLRLGTCYEYRHPVDEAWPGLGGALRGRSPRTREGRLGPTAQKGEERAKRSEERAAVSSASELIADWTVLRCYPVFRKVRRHFGMHPNGPISGARLAVVIAYSATVSMGVAPP